MVAKTMKYGELEVWMRLELWTGSQFKTTEPQKPQQHPSRRKCVCVSLAGLVPHEETSAQDHPA